MGKYGATAIRATRIFQQRAVASPKQAWEWAAEEVFPGSVSSQEKGCPRSSFLGLCDEGLIAGIPAGEYSPPGKQLNKGYTLKALKLLKDHPEYANDEKVLWKLVMKGGDDENKKPNRQMDVVISLWNEGLIRI